MEDSEEITRLIEWFYTLSEQVCYKRLKPGEDVNHAIPECWDRTSIPKSWYKVCASCRARIAVGTDWYPSESGGIFEKGK